MNWTNPWFHLRLIFASWVLALLVGLGHQGGAEFVITLFAAACFVYGWTMLLSAEVEDMMAKEATDRDGSD